MAWDMTQARRGAVGTCEGEKYEGLHENWRFRGFLIMIQELSVSIVLHDPARLEKRVSESSIIMSGTG